MCLWTFFHVNATTISGKDKEVAATEEAEEHNETEEDKKRHLNVVFIGHVGKQNLLPDSLILFALLALLISLIVLFYGLLVKILWLFMYFFYSCSELLLYITLILEST